jgi:SAM-dependent methyltransferase
MTLKKIPGNAILDHYMEKHCDEQQRTFDTIAPEYDRTLPRHIQIYYRDKRLRLLNSVADRINLGISVGAGTGFLEAGLTQWKTVVCCDLSFEMCRAARKKGLRFVLCASAGELPFKSRISDVCFSIATFHHLAESPVIKKAVSEMIRITREGGSCVIWDHNPKNPYWPLLMHRVPQDNGRERLIPYREMKSLLDRSNVGWSSFYSGWVPDFAPPWSLGILRRIEFVLERLPLVRLFSAHAVYIIDK